MVESADISMNKSSCCLVRSLSLPYLSEMFGGKAEEKQQKKFTSAQLLTLATICFGNFCIGACASLQAPFFPKEAERKGASSSEYGLIFGLYQLTIFLTAPIMGKLISVVDPKFMLNSGIFAVGVTCELFGILGYVRHRYTFVYLAFSIRILEGVGAAALRTAAISIIACQFTDNVATAFATIETFLGIGLILGPTIGGTLYDIGGYGFPFYVAGALILLDSVIIFFVLPAPKPAQTTEGGNCLKFWKSPVILIYAYAVFSNFNYLGFNGATLEPHIRQFQLSGLTVGLIFALPAALYACLGPFWGWLCDRKWEKRLLILFGCSLTIISMLMIGPMPFLRLPSKLKFIIAAQALFGIASGAKLIPSFVGSLDDAISRGFTPGLPTYGMISSMFASSQSLGSFVGPCVGGYLLDVYDYHTSTFVALSLEVILFVCLVIYIVVSNLLKSKENNEEKTVILLKKRDVETERCR